MSSEESDSNRMAWALVNIENQLAALNEWLVRYGEQHLEPPLPSPGIHLVKFRELTEKEVEYGKSLVPMVKELDKARTIRQVLGQLLRGEQSWELSWVECPIIPAEGTIWLIVREGDVGYMVLDTEALGAGVLEHEFMLAMVFNVEFLAEKENEGWIELQRVQDGEYVGYDLLVTGLGVVC